MPVFGSDGAVAQRIAVVEASLSGKASQSAVDALSSTVGGKASSGSLTALAATIPSPADTMPPSVVDGAGAVGVAAPYARSDHTHASKARKERKASSGATYTWVYPTAFGAGVVPIISAIAQVASGNTDLYNIQVLGTPTNTQCQIQINRVSGGLLALLLGALSINPTPGSITLHLIALEP